MDAMSKTREKEGTKTHRAALFARLGKEAVNLRGRDKAAFFAAAVCSTRRDAHQCLTLEARGFTAKNRPPMPPAALC